MSEDTSNVELSVQDKLKETLIIDRFSSKCGNCGKGADPYEKRHEKQLGWGEHDPNGCGVEWHYITSDYTDMEQHVSAMRPDLEWYDRWERPVQQA